MTSHTAPTARAPAPQTPERLRAAPLAPRPTLRPALPRPRASSKFLFRGDEKLRLCGVTYGTFRPGPDGCDYPSPEMVDLDFSTMRLAGITTVRTYTPPPRWLLDTAAEHELTVL